MLHALCTAVALFIGTCAGAGAEADAGIADEELDLKDLDLSLWDKDIGLRTGFGYKDNILLSPRDAEGSVFWEAEVEALTFRLPTGGWFFSAMVDAEYTRYLDPGSVDNDSEQFVLATTQLSKNLGELWKTTFGLNYIYQDQVFDISATETNRSIGRVRGHTMMPRWELRRNLGEYWAEFQASGSRQWLAEPLDDYWQAGPKLTLGRKLPRRSELTFSYAWSWLWYDTREQFTRRGDLIPGSSLKLNPHTFDLTWRQHWDDPRRWQTTTLVGFELNRDNGEGFFDYHYYRVAEQLKYRAETWELSASGRLGYYHYPVQPVAYNGDTKRHRTVLALGLHAEKDLGKAWKLFMDYSFDRSLSNEEFDEYQVNTVSGGVEFRF